MNCQEAQPLKHAYADGELDVVRTMEVEKHLRACPACSQAYENVRELKSVFKSDALYFKAPAQLKQRIRTSLRSEEVSSVEASEPSQRSGVSTLPRLSWRWVKLAIPVAATALIAFLVWPLVTGSSASDRLAREITSSHVRSLMASHLTDVASSDQHTVKPWFDGKLDFAPPVIDSAGRGFPLVGGRLDYVQSRPVAALVYQRQKHFINLFIWPTTGHSTTAKKIEVRQGYNLIHWDEAGMTYWAVSDLNARELRDFVDFVNAPGK